MSKQEELTVEKFVELLKSTNGKGRTAKRRAQKEKENISTVERRKVNKIILPEGMPKLEAAKELQRQHNEEETSQVYVREFKGWEYQDVMVALKHVAAEEFGWVNGVPTPGFFGSTPPAEISVITDIINGKKITETCFFGSIGVSAWEGAAIRTAVGDTVRLICECKKRYGDDVNNFYNLVEQYLKNNSFYRGKSITVGYRRASMFESEGLVFEIFENSPSDKIFLNSDEQLVMDNFVIGSLGEPGKRCYLFVGDYGNGKTETAMKVGRAANEKDMAFFYCEDTRAFTMLLKNAVNYQPCIVFLEDIDDMAGGQQRDQTMNKILNTLDGVETKNKDVTVIFTTNHVDRINKAARRPGRIDIVLNFSNPDKDTLKVIYKSYFKGLKGEDKLDYDSLVEKTPSVQGAVAAEIAKRAVKLAKSKGEINNTLVQSSIASMKYHIELMDKKPEDTELDKLKTSLCDIGYELIAPHL